jgi:hypothetical protein
MLIIVILSEAIDRLESAAIKSINGGVEGSPCVLDKCREILRLRRRVLIAIAIKHRGRLRSG